MKISLADLKKVEHTGMARGAACRPEDTVSAIFKVKEPWYVPPTVRLRARIDATLFTGEMQADSLAQIEADPNVVSVSLAKPLRVIE